MIVYDTGALVAAERGARPMWALHEAVLRERVSPLVPAPVLAQAWRGGPQPNLSRLLAGCTVVPMDESLARVAGAMCAKAGTADVVDASVVALADITGAGIVGTDGKDLRALLSAAGVDAPLHLL